MFEPMSVVVWARSAVCWTPEAGALLQYIPLVGAIGKSNDEEAGGDGKLGNAV